MLISGLDYDRFTLAVSAVMFVTGEMKLLSRPFNLTTLTGSFEP